MRQNDIYIFHFALKTEWILILINRTFFCLIVLDLFALRASSLSCRALPFLVAEVVALVVLDDYSILPEYLAFIYFFVRNRFVSHNIPFCCLSLCYVLFLCCYLISVIQMLFSSSIGLLRSSSSSFIHVFGTSLQNTVTQFGYISSSFPNAVGIYSLCLLIPITAFAPIVLFTILMISVFVLALISSSASLDFTVTNLSCEPARQVRFPWLFYVIRFCVSPLIIFFCHIRPGRPCPVRCVRRANVINIPLDGLQPNYQYLLGFRLRLSLHPFHCLLHHPPYPIRDSLYIYLDTSYQIRLNDI